MIETINLHKNFKNKRILKGLCFTAEKNKITLLAGRNGAGKTTWQRIALGLARPTDGDVLFRGLPASKIRGSISAVCDEPPMYSHMNGEENLRLISACEVDNKWANKIKQILNLDQDFLKLRASHYSLGQRRRLAIAAALLRKPDYLFLDEPTVGLDPVAWSLIKESLLIMVADKTSVVLTGQDFNGLEKLIDKVVIISDGLAKFEGSVSEFTEKRPPRVRIKTNDKDVLLAHFSEFKIISNSEECPTFECACTSISQAHEIISSIKNLEIKFHALKIQKDTLEEAFIEIEKQPLFSEQTRSILA